MVKNIILLMAAMLMAVSGCSVNLKKSEPIEPLKYYRYAGYKIKSIGRVVMFEMGNLSPNQQIGEEMTRAVSEEIQKKQIFGLETIYMKDPMWNSLNISADSDIPTKTLEEIQKRFKADAVIYGRIMHYRPYPRNSIGLTLKMVDCATGTVLWGIDSVWDSTDANTERRAKQFFDTEMRSGYGPEKSKIVILSPRIYNKFIAHEISQTLQ